MALLHFGTSQPDPEQPERERERERSRNRMKFGKRLQSQIDGSLPEWRDKYLSYKRLKKRLKMLCSSPPPSPRSLSDSELSGCSDTPSSVAEPAVDCRLGGLAQASTSSSSSSSSSSTVEEIHFIHLLNAEVEKFNAFFIEKEEEYVIRLQELKERIEKVKAQSRLDETTLNEIELNEKMIEIRKDFVNFHGEMVLLESYSSLNYTGLTKILKKHDKLTGALLRMPFIQKVLRQPFFTTELLSKLVCECEATLRSFFPTPMAERKCPPSPQDHSMASPPKRRVPKAECEAVTISCLQGEDFENIYRGTMAALKTIKELRKGSSTYNLFSLPPIGQSDGDDGFIIESGKTGTSCCLSIPICPKG